MKQADELRELEELIYAAIANGLTINSVIAALREGWALQLEEDAKAIRRGVK